MAKWSWIAADRHIEWEYDQANIPQDERLRPAISFTTEAEKTDLGDYPHIDNVLVRLAILRLEEGTEARVELVFEMAPFIEQV